MAAAAVGDGFFFCFHAAVEERVDIVCACVTWIVDCVQATNVGTAVCSTGGFGCRVLPCQRQGPSCLWPHYRRILQLHTGCHEGTAQLRQCTSIVCLCIHEFLSSHTNIHPRLSAPSSGFDSAWSSQAMMGPPPLVLILLVSLVLVMAWYQV